jgi:hypothetical protein
LLVYRLLRFHFDAKGVYSINIYQVEKPVALTP